MALNTEFSNKLNDLRKSVPQIVKRLPGIAKVEGLRFIADNFDKEGFETKPGVYKEWKKKQTKRARKKTLMGEKWGGSLKRSWQQETTNTETHTEFTSSLPYAEVHNDGMLAGRPPGFTMPERKMIGDSEALDKRIENKLDRMVDETMK